MAEPGYIAPPQDKGTLVDWLRSQNVGTLTQMPDLDVRGGQLEMKPSEWRMAQANADDILALAKSKGVDINQFSDVRKIAALGGNQAVTRDELTAYVVGLDVSANAFRHGTSLGTVMDHADVTPSFMLRDTKMDVALAMAKEALGDNKPDISVANTSAHTDYTQGMQLTPVLPSLSGGRPR